jgi:hypothetical protein
MYQVWKLLIGAEFEVTEKQLDSKIRSFTPNRLDTPYLTLCFDNLPNFIFQEFKPSHL